MGVIRKIPYRLHRRSTRDQAQGSDGGHRTVLSNSGSSSLKYRVVQPVREIAGPSIHRRRGSRRGGAQCRPRGRLLRLRGAVAAVYPGDGPCGGPGTGSCMVGRPHRPTVIDDARLAQLRELADLARCTTRPPCSASRSPASCRDCRTSRSTPPSSMTCRRQLPYMGQIPPPRGRRYGFGAPRLRRRTGRGVPRRAGGVAQPDRPASGQRCLGFGHRGQRPSGRRSWG